MIKHSKVCCELKELTVFLAGWITFPIINVS